MHPGYAGSRRKAGGDEVPPALEERSPTYRVGYPAAGAGIGAEPQPQRAGLVDFEREP